MTLLIQRSSQELPNFLPSCSSQTYPSTSSSSATNGVDYLQRSRHNAPSMLPARIISSLEIHFMCGEFCPDTTFIHHSLETECPGLGPLSSRTKMRHASLHLSLRRNCFNLTPGWQTYNPDLFKPLSPNQLAVIQPPPPPGERRFFQAMSRSKLAPPHTGEPPHLTMRPRPRLLPMNMYQHGSVESDCRHLTMSDRRRTRLSPHPLHTWLHQGHYLVHGQTPLCQMIGRRRQQQTTRGGHTE